MLLIHKSVLKELFISFLFSILFLNFSLMMEKLIRITRLLAGVGSSFLDILTIIIYLQPETLIITIPMALLLSILLVYGRMSADNELIILQNLGMTFFNISKPVMYLGVICFFVSISMSFFLGPKSSILLREKISDILTKRSALTIEEGIFNTAFKDIVILVREKPSEQVLKGVLLLDDRQKEEQKIIFAKEAIIETQSEGIAFALLNGQVYISKRNSITEIHFEKYQFLLVPSVMGYGRKKSELSPFELLVASELEQDQRIKYILEFHRRVSLPLLCFLIVFLAPPLSLLSGRSGKLGGVTLGLAVFVIYYSILLYGENLAKSGKIPPFFGSWISFIILMIFSILLFYRANKK
ncbi:MAG: LptF/LptG family permease [Thermodesulfovibrionales bacterium]|nr:LptF/LptG family permease [Thermodesulfovibrionales bacterium]